MAENRAGFWPLLILAFFVGAVIGGLAWGAYNGYRSTTCIEQCGEVRTVGNPECESSHGHDLFECELLHEAATMRCQSRCLNNF